MISMLKEVDQIEAAIMEGERNGKMVFELIDKIGSNYLI